MPPLDISPSRLVRGPTAEAGATPPPPGLGGQTDDGAVENGIGGAVGDDIVRDGRHHAALPFREGRTAALFVGAGDRNKGDLDGHRASQQDAGGHHQRHFGILVRVVAVPLVAAWLWYAVVKGLLTIGARVTMGTLLLGATSSTGATTTKVSIRAVTGLASDAATCEFTNFRRDGAFVLHWLLSGTFATVPPESERSRATAAEWRRRALT